MKKSLFMTVLLGLSVMLSAQGPFPTEDQMKAFRASTTCVVLEDDPFSLFNPVIKEAVKKVWTITSYEFISTGEFQKRMKDPSYSFLVLTSTAFEKDRAGAKYDFLNLLQGDPVNNLSKLPEFCSFPLAYSNTDDDGYVAKMEVIVRFVQQHVTRILEHPGSPSLKYRYLKYYNVNMQDLGDKELWLAKEDLVPELREEAAVKALYPHPFRLVSRDEIDKALNDPPAGMAFLFVVKPGDEGDEGRVYKMILDPQGKMYYFNYHLISKKKPNGFLPSDLKRLGKF